MFENFFESGNIATLYGLNASSFSGELHECHKKNLEIEENKKIAKKVEELTLELNVKAGANGKTFGGITSKEISEGLKKQAGLDIDKKKIIVKETIKTIGTFTIDVKFGDGVNAKLKINIKPE